MSRVGRQPIDLPSGVTITTDNGVIAVSGPKGTLEQVALEGIALHNADNQITLSRNTDEATLRAKHGLMRALVNNMVEGVSKGFQKKLELNGVGYRAAMQGSDIKLNIGFSHDVIYKMPAGITATIEQNIITITGISKQQVGQAAAEIRALKKPEPYKGKGIKYVGERIIKKAGKSGKDK